MESYNQCITLQSTVVFNGFGHKQIKISSEMTKQETNQKEVQYRKAIAQDVACICQIYNSYVDAGGATFATDYWKENALAGEIINNPENIWFVAEKDTQIIGWASARLYSSRHGYRLTRELAVYFELEHVGKGYAYDLVKKTESVCVAHGIHHLVSRVIAGNQQSLQFHLRCGYEMVGIQREIGNLNDQWLDVAILQKLIT